MVNPILKKANSEDTPAVVALKQLLKPESAANHKTT
jgi:hypothetical protein